MSDKHEELSKQVKHSLSNLSSQDFRNFGLAHIAYIRAGKYNDKNFFAVFSADGRKLYTADTMQDAIILARQDDLEPVTVH